MQVPLPRPVLPARFSVRAPIITKKQFGEGHYEGTFEGVERNGTGTMKFTDGSVYVGSWLNDKQNGQGTLTTTEGDSYTGWWKAGKFYGLGTYTWGAPGKSYHGLWANGMKEGKGTHKWPDGSSYEGEWLQNKCEGRGVWQTKEYTYDGMWHNDKKHGKGTIKYANGTTYEGLWADGERSGHGVETKSNGDSYDGEWAADKKEGPGVWTFKNAPGDILSFHCNFKNGMRNGLGKFILKGQREILCHWVNDQPDPGKPNAVLKENNLSAYCPWKPEGQNFLPVCHGKGASINLEIGEVTDLNYVEGSLQKIDSGYKQNEVQQLREELQRFKCEIREKDTLIAQLYEKLYSIREELDLTTNLYMEQEADVDHTFLHIQRGVWVKSIGASTEVSGATPEGPKSTNSCKMKKVSITFDKQKIAFVEHICYKCPVEKVVKMEVEKRFKVDESQQHVLLIGKGGLVSLTDTSSTLLNLESLLPPPISDVVAQFKVQLVPVITIQEAHLEAKLSLGTGSYGTVFRCSHIPSGRDVAVKTLHEVIMSNRNSDRFFWEAEILSGLRHPNVVKCIGTCITSTGRLKIVSELMCCSLRQLLKQKRLTFKEVVALSLGVAKGMDSLHRQNYMHRDLSSNNVLMDVDGTPKICDFGVSHGMNTQQPQSIVPGTSVHMAPQMFTNHYSIEGDVWGFAVLLTEIFNGEIVDSIFDTLPLDLHATFVGAQKAMLSQSDAEEVDRLCLRQAMQVTIAHCLSRRLESLKKVKHLLTSPQSPLLSAGPIPNAVAKLLFMILRSCFSILEKNRSSFTVISKLLFCCCTEATVNDLSKNTIINTGMPPPPHQQTMVTDYQVTDSITQWLSALVPFIQNASQRL